VYVNFAQSRISALVCSLQWEYGCPSQTSCGLFFILSIWFSAGFLRRGHGAVLWGPRAEAFTR